MRSASFRVVIRHKNVTAWVGCQPVRLVLHWRCQGLAGDRELTMTYSRNARIDTDNGFLVINTRIVGNSYLGITSG
jgi:hypothetical protein